MRNANAEDIKRINGYYEVPFNVMFRLQIDGRYLLAHRKHTLVELNPYIMMETTDGKVFSCVKQELEAVPHKPNNQKPKKRYTRPSRTGFATLVPYDSSLIKVGTKVKLRNGDKETVVSIYPKFPVFVTTKTRGSMLIDSGKKSRVGLEMENDIVGVYVTTKNTVSKDTTPSAEKDNIPIYFTQEEINVLDDLIGWGVGGKGKQREIAHAVWKKISKKATNDSDSCPDWLEGMINIRS